jgi:hypothetical protein
MIAAGGESFQERRKEFQLSRINALSRGLDPTGIIALPHARHVSWRLRCDKARKYCPFRKPARDTRHDGEHPIHPWCGPWPSWRENPLHVQTQMNCLGCQRIRKKSFAHDRYDLCKVQNSSMAMAAAAMMAVVAQPRMRVRGATVKRPI